MLDFAQSLMRGMTNSFRIFSKDLGVIYSCAVDYVYLATHNIQS